MSTLSTFVEVLVVRSIERVQPVKDVFAGMRVNHVQKDSYSQAVCCVNQLFELLGGPVTRTRSEEAVNLVAERCWDDELLKFWNVRRLGDAQA